MSLNFESAIEELEKQINILRDSGESSKEDIEVLEERLKLMIEKRYKNLTAWQRVLVARHINRPKLCDYLNIFQDVFELQGDRRFKNDKAIFTGIAKFHNKTVAIVGHNKGRNLDENVERNFGMPTPSGYYKAIRLMEIAEKLDIPIISFVDTPGADSGLESEEQGQFIAIAKCIDKALSVSVPIISIIIGEGGSGGAVALATADLVLILENAVYSVISPEGCSSILWKSSDYKEVAAQAQKLSAFDIKELKIADEIIEEPIGGAHRNKDKMLDILSEVLLKKLEENFTSNKIEKFIKITEEICGQIDHPKLFHLENG